MGAVLAAVLCAGLLSGCSEEPAPQPERETRQLTRAEFVDRADEICRRGDERVDAVTRRLEGRRPAAVDNGIRDEVVPILRKTASDLRALNGPPRLERQVGPVLDEVDRLLDFVALDPAQYDDLLFVGVEQDFTRLGLTDCGK